jgi:hypothetical protein
LPRELQEGAPANSGNYTVENPGELGGTIAISRNEEDT